MLSVIAAPIARLRRAKLVNWLQDIFPEVAQALEVGSGPLSRIAYRLMARARTRSLKAAALNVALGERMDARLHSLGIKADRIRIIANWADGALLAPVEPSANAVRRSFGLSDKFVVGYSGNLGRAHDLKTLLDAIALIEKQYGFRQHTERDVRPSASQSGAIPLDYARAPASNASGGKDAADRPEIVWLFIGGGAQFETLRREVNERGLTSVHFAPYQPRERLAESLSAADVHLVSLKPALEGLIVPSKIYGIAAVGRPTIFIGDLDGEIARLLVRFDCGLTIPEGESSALARAVQDLATCPKRRQQMGANARQAFVAEFDKALAVARWQKALAELRTRPAFKSLIFTQR
jgi:glycosyltransferase involved in cell wall biosynthesis